MNGQEPKYIIRCRDAGVHFGSIVAEDGVWLRIADTRRIWYWAGAASLSELAVYGPHPSKVDACRFGCRLATHALRLADTCEVIECRREGAAAIEAVKEWRFIP